MVCKREHSNNECSCACLSQYSHADTVVLREVNKVQHMHNCDSSIDCKVSKSDCCRDMNGEP